MKTLYISEDVETTGPIPGKYSMISIGACVVGGKERFYREIKPLNLNFVDKAIDIGSKGLKCKIDNPRTPYNILSALVKFGETPIKVMHDYERWIDKIRKKYSGYKIVEAAAPIKFDGMFVNWYFHKFVGYNPLGHTGTDINSLYKGISKNLEANIEDFDIRGKGLKHNALDDAIQQKRELEKVLELIEL